MSNTLAFSVRDVELLEKDGKLSLTVIWKLAGEPANLQPAQWSRFPSVMELVEQIASEVNVCPTHIYESKRGKGGGTWAHWKVALAYAASLDPALHSEILGTYRKVKEGDLALASAMVRKNDDIDQLKRFRDDVENYLLYKESLKGIHDELKGHNANLPGQHAAYNSFVNKTIGVEPKSRGTMSRKQTLMARTIHTSGEIALIDNQEVQGWQAVKLAKQAGETVIKALNPSPIDPEKLPPA